MTSRIRHVAARRPTSRLRALVAAAAALAGQRMLILDSVLWHVARLLKLMGWDQVPGLRIETSSSR